MGATQGGGYLANSAYSFSSYIPLIPILLDGIPIASGGLSPSITFIPGTKTICVGLSGGFATGAGKTFAFTFFPSKNAKFTKDVISSYGYNLGAQVGPLAGISVNTNSSGSLVGYTVASDSGLSATYGYTKCADF